MIKFKAWDKKKKKWLTVENMPVLMSGEAEKGIIWSFGGEKDIVFCQFTDKKDKKNNDIYSNDIIKQTGGYQDRIFNVKYSGCSFNLPDEEIYDDGQIYARWKLTYEIIGNIFENPELMKGNNESNNY